MEPVTIAAIVALAGAVGGSASGLFGTIINGKKAWNQANDQQQHLDALYALQKQRAEEEFNKAKKEAERNAEKMQQQSILANIESNLAERTISTDFNTAIDSLYLSQEGDALNYNLQAIQNDRSIGSAFAGLGSSGVRAGSSLSEAVELEGALNETQLQFAQDSQRKSYNNSLKSVLNQLAGNEFGIKANRETAAQQWNDSIELENSFKAGGSNYNLYELQKQEMEQNYQYNYKTLQKEKERWWKDGHLSWDAFWEGATTMLSLGAKGAQTGYQLYDTGYKAMNYSKV